MLFPVDAHIPNARDLSATSMEPVRRRRGRPRNPEADRRILTAASELILRRGFDSMTIDEVARRAQVGKATVYRRWSGKEDLAVAAVQNLYNAEVAVHDTGSLRGDLEASYAARLAFVNSEMGAAYLRLVIKESMRDPRIGAIYSQGGLDHRSDLFEVFERAQERGEIAADVDVTLAAEFLGALLVVRAVNGEKMPSQDSVDSLVDFVLRGVGAA